MRTPPRPEPFPLAKDLRESQVSNEPLWAKKMALRHRLMRRDIQTLSKGLQVLVDRLNEHDARYEQRLQVKQHAITVLKNLPLVLGVLSIMFPHLKPIFEAIAKGLGAH